MSRKTLKSGSWCTVMLVFYFDSNMKKELCHSLNNLKVVLKETSKMSLGFKNCLRRYVQFRTSYPKYDNPAFGSQLFLILFSKVTSWSSVDRSFVWLRQTPNETLSVFFSKWSTLLIQIHPKLNGIFTTAFFFSMNELFNRLINSDFWSDSICTSE